MYSRASSRKSEMGMEPFRCAWSSALGSFWRKLIWEGVRLRKASAANPEMGDITVTPLTNRNKYRVLHELDSTFRCSRRTTPNPYKGCVCSGSRRCFFLQVCLDT